MDYSVFSPKTETPTPRVGGDLSLRVSTGRWSGVVVLRDRRSGTEGSLLVVPDPRSLPPTGADHFPVGCRWSPVLIRCEPLSKARLVESRLSLNLCPTYGTPEDKRLPPFPTTVLLGLF